MAETGRPSGPAEAEILWTGCTTPERKKGHTAAGRAGWCCAPWSRGCELWTRWPRGVRLLNLCPSASSRCSRPWVLRWLPQRRKLLSPRFPPMHPPCKDPPCFSMFPCFLFSQELEFRWMHRGPFLENPVKWPQNLGRYVLPRSLRLFVPDLLDETGVSSC